MIAKNRYSNITVTSAIEQDNVCQFEIYTNDYRFISFGFEGRIAINSF